MRVVVAAKQTEGVFIFPFFPFSGAVLLEIINITEATACRRRSSRGTPKDLLLLPLLIFPIAHSLLSASPPSASLRLAPGGGENDLVW